jgi:Ca2+:H+ antiporter
MTKDNALANLWHNFPLKTSHTILNVLLLALPAALVAHWFLHLGHIVEFALAALAIIPLAGAMGEATEDLSSHLGERAGGLLNATMGNATELIIGFFALRAGHVEIVKASISGSIIGNVLLVFGASMIAGGIKHRKQTFSRHDAAVNSTMLFIAAIALIMPAVFDLSIFGSLREGAAVERLSLWTSAILIAVYASSMIFTFKAGPAVSHGAPGEHARSAKAATIALVTSTVAVAYMSEILVSGIEAVKKG